MSIFLNWFARINMLFLTMLISCNTDVQKDKVRPENISQNAFFIGGVDGGVWVDIIRQKDALFEIEIFAEVTGITIEKKWFSAENNCPLKIDSIEKLRKYLVSYDGAQLQLKLNSISCILN